VKKLRRSLKWLFITAIFRHIGMCFERFVLIITSLAHEFVPYAWGVYKPRPVEISIMIGTFCFFFMMFLLCQVPPGGRHHRKEGRGALMERLRLSQRTRLVHKLEELIKGGVKPEHIRRARRTGPPRRGDPGHEAKPGTAVHADRRTHRHRHGLPVSVAHRIDWPLYVGNKTLIGIPPYTVIGFRC